MSREQAELRELEGRIMAKVMSRLYLDLVPSSGEMRAGIEEALVLNDHQFGLERPQAGEIHRLVESLLEAGSVPDGDTLNLMMGELVMVGRQFAANWSDQRDTWRTRFTAQFETALQEEQMAPSVQEREELLDILLTDFLGFGPLEPLLCDDTVAEILVDGPESIYVERAGKLEDTPHRFRDRAHLMGKIHRILAPTGVPLNAQQPLANSRLPDLSRVNVVLPPISLVGPALTILKRAKRIITWEDLIEWQALSEDMMAYLRACVLARLNILVVGNMGSGKTSLLNCLTGMIPGDERVVVVEPRAELYPSPHLEHIVRLEARPAGTDGRGEVSMRDLVTNSLRMRPDRIVVGECRGDEVLDLIQAMNTGHDGCLLTLHGSGPNDALARLEMMALRHVPMIQLRNLREQIAQAVNLIVFQERMGDGSRKVTKVSEVAGMEGDTIVVQDIFVFRQTGMQEGRVMGYHTATGVIPRHAQQIAQAFRSRESGMASPLGIFTPRASRRSEEARS